MEYFLKIWHCQTWQPICAIYIRNYNYFQTSTAYRTPSPEKKWRQWLRSPHYLARRMGWWLGLWVALQRQMCCHSGVVFPLSQQNEWWYPKDGAGVGGGVYFRSPHTRGPHGTSVAPTRPLTSDRPGSASRLHPEFQLSALWFSRRPLLNVSFRPGSFGLVRFVWPAPLRPLFRSFVLTFAFCLCPRPRPPKRHHLPPRPPPYPATLPKQETVGRKPRRAVFERRMSAN